MELSQYSFSQEELKNLEVEFNISRNNPVRLREMEDKFLAVSNISGNFTFQQYLDVVAESHANLYLLQPASQAVIVTIYILISVFSVLANGLVCFLILDRKNLRTATNLLIVNLAISDIIMTICCMPFSVVKLIMQNWPLGTTLCKIIPFLQGITVFTSTLTITSIALERYFTIAKPTCCQQKDVKRILIYVQIGLIWFVSAIFSSPLFVFSQVQEVHVFPLVNYTKCWEVWPAHFSKVGYAASIMVIQFALPAILLGILHWKLSSFFKNRIIRNPQSRFEIIKAIKDSKRHRKNTSLLMAIAIMFALCWFPLSLINLLADFDYNLFISKNFTLSFTIAHMVAMLSTCVNPILYGWFNANFRHEFAEFVFPCRSSDIDINLQLPEEQVIAYKRQMSYKAIQTDIQPPTSPTTRKPTMIIEAENINMNSNASFHCNDHFSSSEESLAY